MSDRAMKPKRVSGLILGGEPRVDLLPLEVHEATRARGVRRLLLAVVVLALVGMGAGYGFATVRAMDSQASLAAAQSRTVTLLDEQKQYSEAVGTARMLDTGNKTRALATSREIIWADVFDQISASLAPAGYVGWDAMTTAPWEGELAPAGPLRAPRVATLVFTISSASTLDATNTKRQLQAVTGFADATVDLTQLANTGGYETTITLNLNLDALANRFGVAATDASVTPQKVVSP